jgi:hypothetical protein
MNPPIGLLGSFDFEIFTPPIPSHEPTRRDTKKKIARPQKNEKYKLVHNQTLQTKETKEAIAQINSNGGNRLVLFITLSYFE